MVFFYLTMINAKIDLSVLTSVTGIDWFCQYKPRKCLVTHDLLFLGTVSSNTVNLGFFAVLSRKFGYFTAQQLFFVFFFKIIVFFFLILIYVYIIYQHGQTLAFCTIPSGSTSPPKSCLLLHIFWASSPHSLIIWFIVIFFYFSSADCWNGQIHMITSSFLLVN